MIQEDGRGEVRGEERAEGKGEKKGREEGERKGETNMKMAEANEEEGGRGKVREKERGRKNIKDGAESEVKISKINVDNVIIACNCIYVHNGMHVHASTISLVIDDT